MQSMKPPIPCRRALTLFGLPEIGSHLQLTKIIKEAMNDPESYEHVKTTYRDNKDHRIVKTIFRGEDAFGGMINNSVTAKVGLDGEVIEIISQS